ncbi:unnamed protein product [Alternaria alternata]
MEVFRRGVSIDDYNDRIVGMTTFSLWSTARLHPCDAQDTLGTLLIPSAWAPWLQKYVKFSDLDPCIELPSRPTERMHRQIIHTVFKAHDLYLPRVRVDSSLEYVFPPKLNDEVIRRWRYIISDYTGMDLTEQRDRLPAIAGVASQFERLIGGRYLAGLWESALPGDLLWRMDQSGQHTTQYRAPSWSWASIEGKIKYYKMTSYHPEFSIVRTLCDPLSKISPFGEVASGLLEINAIAANLTFSLDSAKDEASSRRPITVEFMGDSAIFIPDCDLTVRAMPLHTHEHGSQQRQYKFLCIGDFNIERNDATISEIRSSPEASHAVSLVIHRVNENGYERVGILERHRVYYPKSLQSMQRGEIRTSPTAFIKRTHERLRESKKENGEQEDWKYMSGLVLI